MKLNSIKNNDAMGWCQAHSVALALYAEFGRLSVGF